MCSGWRMLAKQPGNGRRMSTKVCTKPSSGSLPHFTIMLALETVWWSRYLSKRECPSLTIPSATSTAYCQKLLSVDLVMFPRIHNLKVDFREHDLDHDRESNFLLPLMMLSLEVFSTGADTALKQN